MPEISPRLPATLDMKSKLLLRIPQSFKVWVMGPYWENRDLNSTETDAAVITLGRYTMTFMAPGPFTFTFSSVSHTARRRETRICGTKLKPHMIRVFFR